MRLPAEVFTSPTNALQGCRLEHCYAICRVSMTSPDRALLLKTGPQYPLSPSRSLPAGFIERCLPIGRPLIALANAEQDQRYHADGWDARIDRRLVFEGRGVIRLWKRALPDRVAAQR